MHFCIFCKRRKITKGFGQAFLHLESVQKPAVMVQGLESFNIYESICMLLLAIPAKINYLEGEILNKNKSGISKSYLFVLNGINFFMENFVGPSSLSDLT